MAPETDVEMDVEGERGCDSLNLIHKRPSNLIQDATQGHLDAGGIFRTFLAYEFPSVDAIS